MQSNKGVGRRHKITGLVLGAALLLAASPVLAQDDPTPASARLNVGYFDRASIPDAVMEAMKVEVERLLGSLDVVAVSVDGGDLASSESLPTGTLLNVIVWERLPEAWDLPSHTMGVCPDAGSAPRSVYVFEPAVLAELGLGSRGIDDMRAEDVGRAFGRVIAHEVVHAFATFAGEHRHRGNGLMGADLGRNTLLVPGLEIDNRSGAAFRKGLARALASR